MRAAMPSVLASGIAILLMAGSSAEAATDASEPFSAASGAVALSLEEEPGAPLPPARHDSFQVDEDSGPVELDVLANDAPGTISSVRMEASEEHLFTQGTAALSATGVVIYTPPAHFFGVDSFTYTWQGADGSTAEATVKVVVLPSHPAPPARADCFQVGSDQGPTSLDVLANDSIDPATGQTLTVIHVTPPTHGTVAISEDSRHVTFTPQQGFSGSTHFTYTVSDGNGSTAENRVRVTSRAECEQRDDAVQVAAGSQYTVELKEDGTVWAWGSNAFGQLGNATTQSRLVPVPVSALDHIEAIAAGDNHTVALSKNGHVWAWGNNRYGQLGNGTQASSLTPVQVPNLSHVVAIAVGPTHTVALKADGTVWTWGANPFGQLGNGTTQASPVPVLVPDFSEVVAIAAGASHTVALKADGTVWTWGANTSGQLGNGTTQPSRLPTLVPALSQITTIATGPFHTLAKSENGTLWAWGANTFGQLGNGTRQRSTVPVQVTGLSDVTALAAGSNHTVAVKEDGTVWAWGNNASGQLGLPSTPFSLVPRPVPNFARVTTVSVGTFHTVALKDDGTAWAWGGNGAGQLGNATTQSSLEPVPVKSTP
jgi:alpha-tubulin suppressor-like RCC1 family protein